jgi:hypothetical protein
MRRDHLMWLLLLALVSACAPTNFLSPAQPTIAPQALTLAAATFTPVVTFTPALTFTPTASLTPTASVTPTVTIEPPFAPTVATLISKDSSFPQPCFFNWATKERPELSAQIEAELEKSGFTEVTVKASDFGENCISSETNEVQYFAAMTTEFSLTIPVEQTALSAINTETFNLMTAFKELWSDDNPTGASSQMELIFVSESGDVTVLSNYEFLMGLLTQHSDGKNLLDGCPSLETGPKALRLTCRAN